MKQFLQLDADGYFVGMVDGIASPLEPGVYMTPGNCVDAAQPDQVEGYRQKWNGTGFDQEPIEVEPEPEVPEPTLTEHIEASVVVIDADADAIYKAVLGNRGPEYERAERDAQAFQAAGFAGNAPPYVATWSAASGMSPQAAAEDILAQAQAWNSAAIAIRQNRLNAKAAVRVAASPAEVEAAMATWRAFVSALRGQLGV